MLTLGRGEASWTTGVWLRLQGLCSTILNRVFPALYRRWSGSHTPSDFSNPIPF
jgi:hypothetical protein